VIYDVRCINGQAIDVWCILPNLINYGKSYYELEGLIELVMQVSELMRAF